MLHDSRESIDIAVMDVQESMSKYSDSRDLHDKVCRDLQETGTRFNEAKRKADDAQEQDQLHRERHRRLSTVYASTEENLHVGLGRMGELVQDSGCDTLVCPVLQPTEIVMKQDIYKRLWTCLDTRRRIRNHTRGAFEVRPLN